MPGLLRINDLHDRGYLAFDIADLLALVAEEGAQWAWRLFPMGESTEIIGETRPFGDRTVWELGCQVDASDDGIPLSWEQLRVFASAVEQTICGTYLACREADDFLLLTTVDPDSGAYLDVASAEYYQPIEVAFQAVDSSYWLVYARDDALLRRIGQGFRDVDTLRTW